MIARERDTPRAAVELAQPERVAQALRRVDGGIDVLARELAQAARLAA